MRCSVATATRRSYVVRGEDAKIVLAAERHSASFAALPTLHADAKGIARARGSVLFHNAKVALATLRDGPHVIRVLAGGRAVACGAVPV